MSRSRANYNYQLSQDSSSELVKDTLLVQDSAGDGAIPFLPPPFFVLIVVTHLFRLPIYQFVISIALENASREIINGTTVFAGSFAFLNLGTFLLA